MYKRKFREWGWVKNGTKNGVMHETFTSINNMGSRSRASPTFVANDISMQVPGSSTLEDCDKIAYAVHWYVYGLFCDSRERWRYDNFHIITPDGKVSKIRPWRSLLKSCTEASMFTHPKLKKYAFHRLNRLLPSMTELLADNDPLALVFIWPICMSLHELSVLFRLPDLEFLMAFVNCLNAWLKYERREAHPLHLILESLSHIRAKFRKPETIQFTQPSDQRFKASRKNKRESLRDKHYSLAEALRIGHEATIRAFETVVMPQHPLVLRMWSTYFQLYGVKKINSDLFWKNYQWLYNLTFQSDGPTHEQKAETLQQYSEALILSGAGGSEEWVGQPDLPEGKTICQRCYIYGSACTWRSKNALKLGSCDACFNIRRRCFVAEEVGGIKQQPKELAMHIFHLAADLWDRTRDENDAQWTVEVQAVVIAAMALGTIRRNTEIPAKGFRFLLQRRLWEEKNEKNRKADPRYQMVAKIVAWLQRGDESCRLRAVRLQSWLNGDTSSERVWRERSKWLL